MAIAESDMMHVQSSRRSLAWLLAAAAVVGVVIALWSSFESMVAIWMRDNTFAHGFLIPVLSAYAFWLKRAELRAAAIQPSALALTVLLLTSLVWFIGDIAGVQAMHQLAAVAMTGMIVWTVLGHKVAGVALFPLGYLLFMVPFGEFMVPRLMEFTADFTVLALKASGIPVFRDGFFLSTANGNFEVAEACSGVRYLLAGMVLGVYFVWLEYESWRRRLLFLLAAFVVPILANGIRAYIIVLVAHFSHMRYGTGPDHVVFGRILFAVFMLVLFYVGVKFSDRSRDSEVTREIRPGPVAGVPGLVAAAILTVGIAAAVAAMASATATRVAGVVSSLPPAAAPGWAEAGELELGYAPKFLRHDQSISAAYMRGDTRLELHEFVYHEVSQDSELVNQQNRLFDSELWRLSTLSHDEVELADGRDIAIESAILYRPGQRLRVYSYYIVGGRTTASRLRAKIIEIYDMVFGRSTPSAFVAIATPVQLGQESVADDVLQQFVADHHDRLRECLSAGESGHGSCRPNPAP
jgi:exosortase A